MQGAFFYSIILAFASGIFVRSFFDIPFPYVLLLILTVSALSLWWLKKKDSFSSPLLLVGITVGIFFVVGVARFEMMLYLKPASTLVEELDTKVELTGVVVTEPELTAKSTRLVVEVAGERILVSTDRYAEIKYGDEIQVAGKLQKPEAFETEFGRTFNYPGYLAVRDIFYTVSFAQVEVIRTNQGNYVIEKLLTAKSKFLNSMQTYIPEPEVGLGAGLLLGVKSSLGEELEEDFRTTGIIHIVVLSGANIMLVVIFIMFVLGLVFPIRIKAVIGIVAIVSFALMVGLSATRVVPQNIYIGKVKLNSRHVVC